MIDMSNKDYADLQRWVAEHLSDYKHLTYNDCALVAGVFLAYRLAMKEEMFAPWLERAFENGEITGKLACEEEPINVEMEWMAKNLRSIPEYCEQLWDEYWAKKYGKKKWDKSKHMFKSESPLA